MLSHTTSHTAIQQNIHSKQLSNTEIRFVFKSNIEASHVPRISLLRAKSNQINVHLFDVKKYHNCHKHKGVLQDTTWWTMLHKTDIINLNKIKRF